MEIIQLQPIDRHGTPIDYVGWRSAGQADMLYLVNEQTIHAVTVAEAIAAANAQ